ncbi:BLUF domain-containing protein [Cellvibrio sp. pealriver]|uniref:BLUF domain-containing protein n=1 Tax=Cellvibrio sp. pealriver TaxID=1622269 RepID=UPI00066FBAE6|nr:BLUF domain-containing protein [Cellvibrio sp. pealriver]
MSDLVRLVYASEATFNSSHAEQGIEPEVGRILAQSRRNNARAQVGGVLYYGNGYFFQCLEGSRDAVIETYQRICTDPRHKNATVLLKGFAKRRLFEEWSMKYLPTEKNLRDFLAQHGLTEFSPFDYDREMVGRLLIFFQQSKAAAEPGTSAPSTGQASQTVAQERYSEQHSAPEPTQPTQRKSLWQRLFNR